MKLFEQPPKRFDIFIVIRNIGMVKVYEIAHLFSQFTPFSRKLHHIFATLLIIIGY